MSSQAFDIAASDRDHDPVVTNDVGESPEDLMAAIEATIKPFSDGDLVQGTIVKIDQDEVLVDIGYKSEGVIPARELTIRNDIDPREVVKLGDAVEALVLQKEDKEGRLILSKKRASYERAWGRIEDLKRSGEPVKGTVIEVVKGGLIVDIGLRGFLPASLVDLRRVRELQQFVGREIECKIIELDRNRNNVVLSRRAHLEEAHSEQRREFLENLKPGERRTGTVSSIVNFGAFVDLGGVDGLIHVSELSWKHVEHPSEVVQVGQEVEVEVLSVELDRDRVSLSLKNTQEDPWQAFARTHSVGDIVSGAVTKLVPFGAFVKVAEGIEGLVHISELAEGHVELPDQILQMGQEVTVRIIDVDLERRRISLSLKQATQSSGIPAYSPAIETTPKQEAPAPEEAPAAPDFEREEPEMTPEPEPSAETAPSGETPAAETLPSTEAGASSEEPAAESTELSSEVSADYDSEGVTAERDSLEAIVADMKKDKTES